MTALREEFDELGYHVIRGLLDPGEAARYRAAISSVSGTGDGDFGRRSARLPGGVSRHRRFWPLIFHPGIVGPIRELIGERTRFTMNSDLQVHEGGVLWHRDAACPKWGVGPEWDVAAGEYRILRVAIYLQSHAESGFSLGVMPGSHASGSETSGDPLWIATEPGDCVIIHQRLIHSSSELRGPHYAAYLSYGPEDRHSLNHVRYYRYFRTDLALPPFEPELVQRLRTAGLYLEATRPEDEAGFLELMFQYG